MGKGSNYIFLIKICELFAYTLHNLIYVLHTTSFSKCPILIKQVRPIQCVREPKVFFIWLSLTLRR